LARKSFLSRVIEAYYDVELDDNDTRVVNASVPDLKPSVLQSAIKINENQSLLSDFRSRPLVAGRQSQPANFNFFANTGNFNLGFFWIPKKEPQRVAVEDLDTGAWTPGGLLNVLIDISPDVSKAFWNKLRITGTNVTFKAVDDDGNDDEKGQELVDACLKRVNPLFGGWKTLLTQMQLSIYLYGALATDSEVGLDLSSVNDLFTVLPDTIWFMRDVEQKPIPYQLQYLWGFYGQGGTPANMANMSTLPYRRLNQTTFKYTPFDPSIDDPYGRGPFWPALQVVFFFAQLLRDLQRVVENQAWPHTDFALSWEILQKMMERIAPADLNSADKFSTFISQQMNAIKHEYAALAPQDCYVHGDWLTVNQPDKGTKLFDVTAVAAIARQQLVAALKEIPLFMDENTKGTTEGATEFEIYVHGINRVRDICTDHLCYHLQLDLFMHGHDSNVVAVWEPIRTTQRLADAQAEAVEIQNAEAKEALGYIDHDQASMAITGTAAIKEADMERYMPKRGPGEGEVAKGEDKNTGQNTVKGSTTSKNARSRRGFNRTIAHAKRDKEVASTVRQLLKSLWNQLPPKSSSEIDDSQDVPMGEFDEPILDGGTSINSGKKIGDKSLNHNKDLVSASK